MISRPLLKQSIKANGLSWLLVTLATTFMGAILITVLGSLPTNEIRDSLQQTFAESEIEAELQRGAIDGYLTTFTIASDIYPQAKDIYDLATASILTYQQFNESGHPNALEATIEVLKNSTPEEKQELLAVIASQILTAYELEEIATEQLHEFKRDFVINFIINNNAEELTLDDKGAIIVISQSILDMYEENKSLTKEQLQMIAKLFIENLFYQKLANEKNQAMLEKYGYQSMIELLDDYGFSEIKVNAVVSSGLTKYISFINNDMSHEEAKLATTKSILSQMPRDVSKSLQELGELNINHLVIGSVFYKISGLLLPIVYTIMTANNLIAGQVDSGSMAYVLSTPTKRSKVTITQMIYLLGSLTLMYFIIAVVGFAALALVGESLSISYFEFFLLNIGALITMLALSGICFLASAWFNRSKRAVGVGGGLTMFFLVSTILGLFGSTSIPRALRISAMNLFNYTSIISFFNETAILETGSYLEGFLILLVIALVTYTVGIIKFNRKDLPL